MISDPTAYTEQIRHPSVAKLQAQCCQREKWSTSLLERCVGGETNYWPIWRVDS